jgi:hypothetical protein
LPPPPRRYACTLLFAAITPPASCRQLSRCHIFDTLSDS